jgi:hypothetical protein
MKMAGVTLVAIIGYACALVLLIVIANWKWIALVFPFWMLLISVQMLVTDLRSRHAKIAGA